MFVTIALALIGGIWTAYIYRPIVHYGLYGSNSYYAFSLGSPLAFDFRSENTGPTEIVIFVTISATNATLATSTNGQYAGSASMAIILNARSTGWGTNTFYLIPDGLVASFSVSIVAVTAAISYTNISSISSGITYVIVSQTSYQPVGAQTLFYVKSGFANTYALRP